MTEQVNSARIVCPLCHAHVLARDFADHLEECRRREKFE